MESGSVNRLQFLARLEADGLAGRNGNFGPGTRIASDAGLARAHVKYAKTAQFDAVANGERLLHALEDGFDGELRLRLGDPGAVHHFIDDVELNHRMSPLLLAPVSSRLLPRFPKDQGLC